MNQCLKCLKTFPEHVFTCPEDSNTLTSLWSKGTVIRQKYRILQALGTGAMGAVYKALHLGFEEEVALKVIGVKYAGDPRFMKRFHQEAVILRMLKHPSAVAVYDIEDGDDGRPYIAMEYVEGIALDKLLKGHAPMPTDRVLLIAHQVADALGAAHKLGIVHRDVKPQNILLLGSGKAEQAKVLDFGIARLKEADLTTSGEILGTLEYMSPEQAAGIHGDDIDGRSDIYSLGVVMYEMLTGCLPLKADSPSEWLVAHLKQPPIPPQTANPELKIPDSFARTLMKTLAKEREDRQTNMSELIKELEHAHNELDEHSKTLVPSPNNKASATPMAETRVNLLNAEGGITRGRESGRADPLAAKATSRPSPQLNVRPRPTDRADPRKAPSRVNSRHIFIQFVLVIVVIMAAGAGAMGYLIWREAVIRSRQLLAGHLRQAAQFAGQRLYAQAEQEYRAALEIDSKDAAAYTGLGILMTEEGKLDAAAADFRETLRVQPNDSHAHRGLATVCEKQGKLDEAISEDRRALVLDNSNAGTHRDLAKALFMKGESNQSISEYGEALRRDPSDAQAHGGLGEALHKKGQVDAATAEFREALRLNPDFVDAHICLGNALAQKGDSDGATAEYRDAIRLKPDSADARRRLGSALVSKHELNAAMAEFREALRLEPNDSATHVLLASALELAGDPAGALNEYRAAYLLAPGDAEVRTNYERLLGHQKFVNP